MPKEKNLNQRQHALPHVIGITHLNQLRETTGMFIFRPDLPNYKDGARQIIFKGQIESPILAETVYNSMTRHND